MRKLLPTLPDLIQLINREEVELELIKPQDNEDNSKGLVGESIEDNEITLPQESVLEDISESLIELTMDKNALSDTAELVNNILQGLAESEDNNTKKIKIEVTPIKLNTNLIYVDSLYKAITKPNI